MKLRFTHDYLGRETAMKQYRKGDVDEFSTAQALELIHRIKVAEEVADVPPPPFSESISTHVPKRKRQKDGDG